MFSNRFTIIHFISTSSTASLFLLDDFCFVIIKERSAASTVTVQWSSTLSWSSTSTTMSIRNDLKGSTLFLRLVGVWLTVAWGVVVCDYSNTQYVLHCDHNLIPDASSVVLSLPRSPKVSILQLLVMTSCIISDCCPLVILKLITFQGHSTFGHTWLKELRETPSLSLRATWRLHHV